MFISFKNEIRQGKRMEFVNDSFFLSSWNDSLKYYVNFTDIATEYRWMSLAKIEDSEKITALYIDVNGGKLMLLPTYCGNNNIEFFQSLRGLKEKLEKDDTGYIFPKWSEQNKLSEEKAKLDELKKKLKINQPILILLEHSIALF